MLDTHGGRRPIISISVITALALLGDSLLYSLLPLYAGTLGLSTFMVGLLLSANRWVRLVTSSLASRSFARWGFSGIMLVNVLLTVVSTVAYAFPLGVGCFLAARLLWGACYSHLRLGGYLVALGASPAGLGLALGLIQSFSRLGSMLAVLGGGLLADRWGYSWVMAGAGLFSLGALPFVGGCRGALGKAEIGSVDPLPQGGAAPSTDRLSLPFCNAAGFTTCLVGWGMVLSSLSAVLHQRVGMGIELRDLCWDCHHRRGGHGSELGVHSGGLTPAGRLCDRLGRRVPSRRHSAAGRSAALFGLDGAGTGHCSILYRVFHLFECPEGVLGCGRGDGALKEGQCGEPLQLLAGSGFRRGTAFRVRPCGCTQLCRGVLNRCRCAAGCGLAQFEGWEKAEECVGCGLKLKGQCAEMRNCRRS